MMDKQISDKQIKDIRESLNYRYTNPNGDILRSRALTILDSLAPAQSETESEAVKIKQDAIKNKLLIKICLGCGKAVTQQDSEISGLGLCNDCPAGSGYVWNPRALSDLLSHSPVEKPDFCEWVQEEFESGHWSGSCGIEWVIIADTPKDNGMKFCPKCGKPLKQFEKELEDDDVESRGGGS